MTLLVLAMSKPMASSDPLVGSVAFSSRSWKITLLVSFVLLLWLKLCWMYDGLATRPFAIGWSVASDTVVSSKSSVVDCVGVSANTIISGSIFGCRMKVGNSRVHELFSAWKWQPW